MNIKSKALRLVDRMRTTYLINETRMKFGICTHDGVCKDKDTAVGFKIKLNILQAAAVGAAIVLGAMVYSECRRQCLEEEVVSKYLSEKE